MPCAQAQREVLSGIVVADQNASVLISKQENRDWHHPVVVMECQSFVPLLRLPNYLLQIMRSDSRILRQGLQEVLLRAMPQCDTAPYRMDAFMYSGSSLRL